MLSPGGVCGVAPAGGVQGVRGDGVRGYGVWGLNLSVGFRDCDWTGPTSVDDPAYWWSDHAPVDSFCPHGEAFSKASGLTDGLVRRDLQRFGSGLESLFSPSLCHQVRQFSRHDSVGVLSGAVAVYTRDAGFTARRLMAWDNGMDGGRKL